MTTVSNLIPSGLSPSGLILSAQRGLPHRSGPQGKSQSQAKAENHNQNQNQSLKETAEPLTTDHSKTHQIDSVEKSGETPPGQKRPTNEPTPSRQTFRGPPGFSLQKQSQNEGHDQPPDAQSPEAPPTQAPTADHLHGDSAPSVRTPYRQCAPDHVRLRLHIEYDGTDFSGWQRQTHQSSIQGCLEEAISKICGKPIHVLGASRTDAGVHARAQVAHFDCPRDPEAFDFRYAIQCLTPESVVVREIYLAPRDFHAIALVTDKVYKYRVLNRRVPSALMRRYSHWVRFPLDLEFLNSASQYLVGKQDFKALQTSGTPVQTTVRNVTHASWARLEDDILEFTIRGDGFLKQMVRNIVGTLIDLNQRDQKPEQMKSILETLDRRRAGPTAPPEGLILHQVNYPEDVDKGCRKL